MDFFILLLSFFLFLATLFKLFTRLNLKSGSTMKLPPGPRKLPLIGNMHQLVASSQPLHRSLTDLAAKYGPLMHLQLGEVSTIVVSSPEVAKVVMKTRDLTFANRPRLVATEILFYKQTDIGFCQYGDYWRELRKICTVELLTIKRVQTFQSLRQEEFSNMCRQIASQQSSVISLTSKIVDTTWDVVMKTSLGSKSDELAAITSTVKEIADMLGEFCFADLYPSVKLFRLFSGIRRRAEKLHRVSDTLFDKIIDDHKERKDNRQQKDLVDVLLDFNKPGNELYLTIDNVKAVLMDVFSAGIETSSTTADWAMAEMLKHPTVLKKAQDEVRQVFSDKGYVDESNINELKYLKMVIKEALRMHPPAPLLVPRESREYCEAFGYGIPARSRVLVNVWAIGRDPRYWKDPEEFIPERFVDNSIDYKGNNFEYLPFGGGRRICPGISFGLANVELPLAMLLYHFDWVLPDGIKPENIDMTESLGLSARRKNELLVIPVVKIPLSV